MNPGGPGPDNRCRESCSSDRSDRIGEVKFIHEKHVGKRQVDCLWCHDKIEHGKIKMSKTAM